MRILKSFLILVLLASTLLADGGSLYTRKGIGDLYFALNARRFALGGGALALNNVTDISNLNPAGWNSIKKTRFEIGMYYNAMNLSNSTGSVNYSQTNLSGFSIALPIDTAKGIVLTAGLIPYSNVQYEVSSTSTDPIVGKFTTTFEGNGGINTIYTGLSLHLPLDFSIGAAFEYYYGKIEYNSKIIIDSTAYGDGIFKNSGNFQGTGMNLGLISPDLSKIFGSKDITDFRLAVTFNYVFNMKRDSSEISGNTDSTYTSFSTNQKVKMPSRLGLGATAKLFNRYRVVADYFFQPFEDFTIENKKLSVYKNMNRYSVGMEYTNPSPDRDSFWDKIAYRLGFSYEESQYIYNSTSLNQYAIYAGISIPVGDIKLLGDVSTLDLGFQYGSRGTTSSNLIKENFFMFNIGFSLGELWFRRSDR